MAASGLIRYAVQTDFHGRYSVFGALGHRRVPPGLRRVGGHLGRDDLSRSPLLVRRQLGNVVQVAVGIGHGGVVAQTVQGRQMARVFPSADLAGFGERHRHHVLAGFRTQLVGPYLEYGAALRVRFGARFTGYNQAAIPFHSRQAHHNLRPVNGAALLVAYPRRDIDQGYIHGFLSIPRIGIQGAAAMPTAEKPRPGVSASLIVKAVVHAAPWASVHSMFFPLMALSLASAP